MPQVHRHNDAPDADDAHRHWYGGAVGAGIVLVLLPSAGMLFGLKYFEQYHLAGLPVLAIFGIMVLFGALALTAALFARLHLSNKNQALALPEGSIRAAIALSLIVLFAIISIMLHQSANEPYLVKGLNAADAESVRQDRKNQVLLVVPDACAKADASPCAEADKRFVVHLRVPPAPEATDIAKQLLVLIGTLMTSVTSFYFASRATETAARARPDPHAAAATAAPVASPSSPSSSPSSTPPSSSTAMQAASAEGHVDGCDVPITDATPDHELPPAKGGVA